jgi:hypothetical protein
MRLKARVKMQPYTLHLYDQNDGCIRKMGYVGTTQPGIIYTGVASFQDIKNELQRIGGLGGKIDELWFHTHGAPGIIGTRTGWISGVIWIDATNVGQLKNVCTLAIAPQAKVFFAGCNVGEGQQGDAFLRAAGAAKLGHGGGVMLAATSFTTSYPLFGEGIPPWGSIRAAKVSPGGAVVLSMTGPATILWSAFARAPKPKYFR